MIDWIKKLYGAAKDYIPDDVRRWVHALVAGVAGIIHTVFGHVGKEWDEIWRWAVALAAGAERLSSGVAHFYSLIVHKWLPAIRSWASKQMHNILKYAQDVYRYAVREISGLARTVEKWLSDLRDWVVKHVWDPLSAYIRDIYKKLTDWAYTAWYYITHPDKLAERLFWYLVDLVKKNVWGLALTFGEFGAKVFLANVPRVITLIEKIVADVL